MMMCVWIIFRECLMSVGLLQLGSTAIGVKTKEGVVLAVEKRITSPLLVCLLTLNSRFLISSHFDHFYLIQRIASLVLH